MDAGLLKRDPVLKPGMVLAIEPMVNASTEDVETLDDGWTVVTKDRGLSVHFEHTVAISEDKPVILTRLPTHTQLLNDQTAMLAEPTRAGIAKALITLAEHPELRERLGAAGRRFVEANHTYPAHRRRLNRAYDALWQRLGSDPALNSKRAIKSSS